MKKGRSLKLCVALLLFLLTLGAWLFYLRYEGVVKYQYVLPESPDLMLTIEDAADIIAEQESDYMTAEHLSQMVVLRPQIPASVIRVVLSQIPENDMSISVDVVTNDNGNTVEVSGIKRKRMSPSEILFSFPRIQADEIRLSVHEANDVSCIEVYENGVYVDESKQVPKKLNTCIAILFAALLTVVCLAADIDLRKGKGLAFPVLYAALEWMVLSFCLQTRKYDAYSIGVEAAVYLIFTLATLALCVVYRMLFVRHAPIHWAFAVGGMTMGIIMMLLIQPYTVPDEQTHYFQAYIRSNRILGKENPREIRWEDMRFQEKQVGLYGEMNSYERYIATAADFKLMNEAEETKLFEISEIKSVPLGYVVSGVTVAAARALNLNSVALFYLGRLMNLLVFVALITISIYIIPFGKAAVMCIAIAPVSMQLAASYSYDPIVTAFAFLYVAYVLKLWAQKQDISLRQYLLCLGMALILAPSKIAYVPMTATVFLIPKDKYAFGGRYKWIFNILVVAASGIMLYVMQNRSIGGAAQEGTIHWAEGQEAQGYGILYLITHIKETIDLYLHTFQTQMDSFVGYLFSEMLGWHQLNAYGWLTTLFCTVFFAGSQRVENEPDVCCTPYLRLGLFAVMAMTAAITMLSMLLIFTPLGSYAIAGVQGRYFIPIMALLIPFLRNMQIQITDKAMRWCGFTALWVSMFAAVSLLQIMPQ